MFSTLDLAAAKWSYFKTGHGHYKPQKSEVSFELSQMTSKDRGEILEVMIADYFNRHGIESQRSDTQDYDLDAFVGGRHIRIEVKSAMKAKVTNKYIFSRYQARKFRHAVFSIRRSRQWPTSQNSIETRCRRIHNTIHSTRSGL